eukprot:2175869-Amphidinium_carterae.1
MSQSQQRSQTQRQGLPSQKCSNLESTTHSVFRPVTDEDVVNGADLEADAEGLNPQHSHSHRLLSLTYGECHALVQSLRQAKQYTNRIQIEVSGESKVTTVVNSIQRPFRNHGLIEIAQHEI